MNAARPYVKALEGVYMPARIKALPIDERGYPVPWFVARLPTGKWDFRMIGPGKVSAAAGKHICWICGQRLGRHLAFAVGPMCAINKISSEPPSHLECARFACEACPFLVNPAMRRNEKNLPEDRQAPAGIPLAHNPGATLIWITGGYRRDREGLFHMGPASETEWYNHGRKATPAEAVAAFETGMHRLLDMVERAAGPDRQAHLDHLDKQIETARRLLPREPAR
jgi:hypothetical protein